MSLALTPTTADRPASSPSSAHTGEANGARPTPPARSGAASQSAAAAQRQIRAYAAHPGLAARLEHALARAFPMLGDGLFDWLVPATATAPTNPRAQRELRDAAFWAAIDRADLEAYARDWWPDGGPAWDAIAIVSDNDERTVVLIDTTTATQPATASTPPAAISSAADPRATALIDAAIVCAHDRLHANAPADEWLTLHRHLARRLAWTDWLRDHGQPALLAQVGFAGAQRGRDADATGTAAVAAAHLHALGLSADAISEWCAPVVVPGA